GYASWDAFGKELAFHESWQPDAPVTRCRIPGDYSKLMEVFAIGEDIVVLTSNDMFEPSHVYRTDRRCSRVEEIIQGAPASCIGAGADGHSMPGTVVKPGDHWLAEIDHDGTVHRIPLQMPDRRSICLGQRPDGAFVLLEVEPTWQMLRLNRDGTT